MVDALDNLTVEDLQEAQARVHHLPFMQYCWQRKHAPLLLSKQPAFQKRICDSIDEAIEKYRNGVSSFICFTVCFRHGKSDIVSRYLPAHFLGEFPDDEVLVVSHTDTKANEFGKFGLTLLNSPEYRALYPEIEYDPQQHGVEQWAINHHQGKAQFKGITSGTAGVGGNLIVVDDFFGRRADAESDTIRDSVWTSFTNDVITRRAPVSIIFMVVTPWHVDDPIGRIKKNMKEDPKYPQFEFINFPAEDHSYPSGWLFPERFSPEWYETQKKLLGSYGFQSLMQCDPTTQGGNILRTDKIHFYDDLTEIPHPITTFCRAWDLASSVKQTQKQDPDYTCGVKGFIYWEPSNIPGESVPHMVVDDIIHDRWEATLRQKVIRDTAMADGTIECGMEAFAAYKDAYTSMEEILRGMRTVKKLQLAGDKLTKASPLVPIFEAGNIWIRRSVWSELIKKDLGEFPSGAHDDVTDAFACLYDMCKNQSVGDVFGYADLMKNVEVPQDNSVVEGFVEVAA